VAARKRRSAGIVEQVDQGTAELVADPDRAGAWTLLVDGVPQSHVDLTDPTRLDFEYVRRLAVMVDHAGPPGAPLRVLHLGGGGLTVPRYVAATRPGSVQRVVERDGALTDFVRRLLPLQRGTKVRVTVADARTTLESVPDASFDLVVGDVYSGARMPRTVASTQFAAQVARVLRPTGWYAVNVADLPPLAFTRIQAATLRTAFGDVCVVADPGMLRGRRYGNVVLAATRRPGGLPVDRLHRAVLRDPFPGRVLHGGDLDRFVAGARPVGDDRAAESPLPPPGLFD
jgi:SAM-dependent methyltransferase